jgi:flagellar capping protein FliD
MENINSQGVFVTGNPHISSLHREADDIQAYMGLPATLEDPASLTYRLRDLDVYMARLSDMMIRAKTMRDQAKYAYISENEDELNKLSATVSNRKIDTFLADYNALYNRLDAMYHTMEHVTRDLVTQISYIKKQMEQFGG